MNNSLKDKTSNIYYVPKKNLIKKANFVNLAVVFPNEALDFTPWLSEHLEYINEATDLNLKLVETEKSTDNFRADIIATDRSDKTPKKVVIENQYGFSDFDHLGKIQSYIASLNADYGFGLLKISKQSIY